MPDARAASNRRFDTIFVFVPDYCVLRHFSRLRSHASPFWQQARAGDQRLKNVPPLGEAYSPTRRPRIPVRFSRAYQHAHLLLQVPRIVYVRQGDPGTQEFIASMIESPVQRELGFSVGIIASRNRVTGWRVQGVMRHSGWALQVWVCLGSAVSSRKRRLKCFRTAACRK